MVRGRRLFPRIPESTALPLAAEVRKSSVGKAEDFATLEHPDQEFPPTGGTRTGPAEIEILRDRILDICKQHGFPGDRPRTTAKLDRDCAAELHDLMRITPHTASDYDMWSFLTLCVYPDIAIWRFPEANNERLLGHINRNVFRRLWWRVEILGTPPQGSDPIWDREDVLVQIMERPGLSGSPTLARLAADSFRAAVKDMDPSAYQALMRDFQARILRHAAFTALDMLPRDVLRTLLDELMGNTVESVSTPGSQETRRAAKSGATHPATEELDGKGDTDDIQRDGSLADIPLDEMPAVIADAVASFQPVPDKQLVEAVERSGVDVPPVLRKVVKSFAWYLQGQGALRRDETDNAWMRTAADLAPAPRTGTSVNDLAEAIRADGDEAVDDLVADLRTQSGPAAPAVQQGAGGSKQAERARNQRLGRGRFYASSKTSNSPRSTRRSTYFGELDYPGTEATGTYVPRRSLAAGKRARRRHTIEACRGLRSKPLLRTTVSHSTASSSKSFRE